MSEIFRLTLTNRLIKLVYFLVGIAVLVTVYLATPVTLADALPPPVPTVAPIVAPAAFCSCVSYLRTYIPSTPRVDAIWFKDFPKVTPAVGRVAVFYYPTSGEYHVAYISSIQGDGFTVKEANYHHCQEDTRFVSWQDSHIVGFWSS